MTLYLRFVYTLQGLRRQVLLSPSFRFGQNSSEICFKNLIYWEIAQEKSKIS